MAAYIMCVHTIIATTTIIEIVADNDNSINAQFA